MLYWSHIPHCLKSHVAAHFVYGRWRYDARKLTAKHNTLQPFQANMQCATEIVFRFSGGPMVVHFDMLVGLLLKWIRLSRSPSFPVGPLVAIICVHSHLLTFTCYWNEWKCRVLVSWFRQLICRLLYASFLRTELKSISGKSLLVSHQS